MWNHDTLTFIAALLALVAGGCTAVAASNGKWKGERDPNEVVPKWIDRVAVFGYAAAGLAAAAALFAEIA